MENIFCRESNSTLIKALPLTSPPLTAKLKKQQSVENTFQRNLFELCKIYETQTYKGNSVLLPGADFIQNDSVQRLIDQCARLVDERSKTLQQQLDWEIFNELECGSFLAGCFHMTSVNIRDLEFEISDQKSNLYQVYIGVFNNLLVITNRLLLLFTGKFSEVFLEKKGLVSVLTFLKIKNFIYRLKTKINIKVLMSLIEHLRIQSRYTDKDQKLWLNFSVFHILLGIFGFK
jgi:hypothetical protein